jgi:hypothetical protein
VFDSLLHTASPSPWLDGVIWRSSIIGQSSSWNAMAGPPRSRASRASPAASPPPAEMPRMPILVASIPSDSALSNVQRSAA